MNEFAELFKGRKDAYGRAAGTPRVRREQVTHALYDAHLRGEGSGIGIYPMLDSNEVWFGAIDLDEPNFDLAKQLRRLIPGESFIERSKSGNAHVWVFFESPAPAWAVRAVLQGATEAVGRSEVEVFPKQDALGASVDGKARLGNFINLPYHGDERPVLRHWGDASDGLQWEPVDALSFIERALQARQDPDTWVRRARRLGATPPEERTTQSEFGTQPSLHMCAKHIITNRHENPLQPGHRAVVLFNVARQLLNWRESTEDEVRHWVHELNKAGTDPAPEDEVDRQINNAISGRFTSTGCDDPVMQPYVHPDCPIANGKAGR